MKNITIFLISGLFLFLSSSLFAQALFSDDFESGSPSSEWGLYRAGEELITAADMSSVPTALPTGGSYVGLVIDSDTSYTGAALSLAGAVTDSNYSVEADVYCYANPTGGSAYTGVVFYADSSKGIYIKMVADFDGDQRIRLYNNKLDFVTFKYTFDHTFRAEDITGGIPTEDGWHKMKVEVQNVEDSITAFNCYFDGNLLAGSPIYDTSAHRMNAGQYGLFSFKQGSPLSGYFDNFVAEELAAAETVDLTLQVDMSVQINKGNFTADTDVVRCAGAFQGWAPENAPDMDDTDGDQIYTVTYAVDPSATYEYKFVIGTNWDNAEGSNRSVDVGTTAMTVDPVYFDNDEGVETTEIAVSFQCNMELEIAAARFDPASDTLTARGSFNGWSDATMLAPSVEDPNIYEGSGQYDSFDGDVIFYKFAYTHGGGTNWENNPPTGSGNYEEAVSGDDITNGYVLVPLRGYNNATLETVVNQESVIRFVVDMNGAVDGNGISLEPVSNTFIAGANPPLQWPDGGWPDGDSTKVIFMADDGTNGDETAGDNFWTMEVTFPIYSPLDIEYKYGANWGLPSNGGANDNEGGVGTNHHATIFPSFWSGDAVDDFGTFDTKDVVNGVEQVDSGVPSKYELSQNYPNPFNPSTIINFSIPQSGIVTLRVYNVLGQEVAELVNDVKSAGTYEVSFDASNLTTGMYVYTIQAGNYSATKKMLLVK